MALSLFSKLTYLLKSLHIFWLNIEEAANQPHLEKYYVF